MATRDVINAIVSSEQRAASIRGRFSSKIEVRRPEDCWPWIAKARHKAGYGALNSGAPEKCTIYAHSLSWALANGPIPPGMFILHHCDNPGCCNPAHLYAGTPKQNMQDVKARNRKKYAGHSEGTRRKIRDARALSPPVMSAEGRASVAQKMRDRWQSEEWRQRFSERMSGENNPRFGKRPPEHQLEAVRRNHRKFKGYRHTEETKERMRQAALRRKEQRRSASTQDQGNETLPKRDRTDPIV